MIMDVINYILRLLGFKKPPSDARLTGLEKSANEAKNKIKEIENEDTDIDDVISRLND
jgi:hypothetical protein